MRTQSVVIVFSVFAAACTLEMRSARRQQYPANPQPAYGAPAPGTNPPSPAPQAAGTRSIGRTHRRTTYGTPTASTSALPPTMVGTNVFGTATADPDGFTGDVYVIPVGTTRLPDLNTLTPVGTLYASTLNVRHRAMTGGFPGIDPYRNEYFAIRWEAPLVVDNEADYTFRIASDDGSVVRIDDMVIVDNDGSNGFTQRSGPVHLVRATHVLTVDYFQATGNVGLQLFCRRGSEAERICPTRL